MFFSSKHVKKNENHLYYDPNTHCNFAKKQYFHWDFFLNHIYSICKHNFRGFPSIFDHLDVLFRSTRSLGTGIHGIPLSGVFQFEYFTNTSVVKRSQWFDKLCRPKNGFTNGSSGRINFRRHLSGWRKARTGFP